MGLSEKLYAVGKPSWGVRGGAANDDREQEKGFLYGSAGEVYLGGGGI